jgi:periplasmic protein TonB
VNNVVRALGLGLDQNAIKAIEQWKFRPATDNGEIIPAELNINVDFTLYPQHLKNN